MKANDTKTYKKIVETRKNQMIDYNMKTFGNVSIGIHGKELPKYSSTANLKEYWKLGNKYKENPGYSSRIELEQTQKIWAKPDKLLISDGIEGSGPQDPFKEKYFPKSTKNEIAEKINKINHFVKEPGDETDGIGSGQMHSRWTENVHYFSQNRGAYEENPNMRESLVRYEALPLPSSFNPTGVFEDPLKKLRTMYSKITI